MPVKLIRLVTRDTDGSIRIREYNNIEEFATSYEQVGIDDCSTDLALRGLPVLRGLVGPIPDGKGVARYESPDAFETLTKEWSKKKIKRRRRSSSEIAAAQQAGASPPLPVVDPIVPPPIGSMTTF